MMHHPHKQKQNSSPSHPLLQMALRAVLCFLLVITAAVLGVLLYSMTALSVDDDPFFTDPARFSAFSEAGGSHLYYFPRGEKQDPAHAVELKEERLSGGQSYTYLPLPEIPQNLKNAFIAIEDKRFYTHKGVDLKRTAAAATKYLLFHSSSFGGSTITQQLIKNLSGDDARTPTRKIREILRAAELEKRLCKEEILELYLNIVPMSGGCIGVGAASLQYFGVLPSELSVAECASLAAITQNPSRYHPVRHPKANQMRRDVILSEMYVQGYLSKAEYETAVNTPVTTVEKSTKANNPASVHSWYTDLVFEDVLTDLMKRCGYTREYASRLLYHGGLHIYTPMDPALQDIVEAYYADTSHFPQPADGSLPQSGMILLHPETGDILAVAGAINEKKGDRLLSYATDAKLPPGSVLKPLSVYAPALEYGLAGYETVLDDVPKRVELTPQGMLRSTWPRNASGIYRGLTNVDYALSHSLNTVAVELLEQVGKDRSFQFLHDTLGITSLIDEGTDRAGNPISDRGIAALALGQMNYGATIREITAAYTVFSNGGIYRNARSYLLVTDPSGRVLLDNRPVVRAAISEENAQLMTKMLSNVVKSGTAKAMTLKHTMDVAGKTGTTQYSMDRWFVGYTPYLLAGVWYGCAHPESLPDPKENPALLIWDEIMTRLHHAYLSDRDRISKKHFPEDHLERIRVCADSGLLISDACLCDPRGNRTITAYVVRGKGPKVFCNRHVLVSTPAEDENATENSPGKHSSNVGLLRVNRHFPAEIHISDEKYVLPR